MAKQKKYVITAYNTKTKQKGCEMQNAIITKNKLGRFMAKGDDGDGNTLCIFMSEANARLAIADGVAKADGWK